MDKNTKIAELESKIRSLKGDLSYSDEVGDWKINKYNEYIAAGKEAPFDINEYNVARDAVRKQINEYEEELKKLID